MDLDFGKNMLLWVLVLAGVKSTIGFRFPWEVSIRAKKRLQAKIEQVRSYSRDLANSMMDDLTWL